MPDGQYNVVAAILAGVLVRAWFVWDRRRKADGPRSTDPRQGRPLWPAGGQAAPARAGWQPGWRTWAIGGLAVYSVLYAVAYTLGVL